MLLSRGAKGRGTLSSSDALDDGDRAGLDLFPVFFGDGLMFDDALGGGIPPHGIEDVVRRGVDHVSHQLLHRHDGDLADERCTFGLAGGGLRCVSRRAAAGGQ